MGSREGAVADSGALALTFARVVGAARRLRLRRQRPSRELLVDGCLLAGLLVLVSLEDLRGKLGWLLLIGALVMHLRAQWRRARPEPEASASASAATATSEAERRQ